MQSKRKNWFTFLFGASWRKIFVLHFDKGPVALHSAEEGAAGPRAQSGGTRGDVCPDWQPSWENNNALSDKLNK